MIIMNWTIGIVIVIVILSLSEAYNLPLPLPLRRNIIKVRASGFLPFESDLLLPLGILRQLQHAQDRASRSRHVLPYHSNRAKMQNAKKKPKQQVRLERTKALGGMQMYNLIDDDGELLLNLRVHNDGQTKMTNDDIIPAASFRNDNSINESDSPWLPSMWRPTTHRPTSSSPKPLPLHQYMTSNHLMGERRSFKPQQDWPYK